MDLTLDDLVYHYPDQDDPEIVTRLTAKREFYEVRSRPIENRNIVRGEFFNNQKLVHRFMEHYRKLFLIAEPGMGKSCAGEGSQEHFRKGYDQKRAKIESLGPSLIDYVINFVSNTRNNIEHACILVRGSKLITQMMLQLTCVCSTPGTYDTLKVNQMASETAQKTAIRKSMKFYTIESYEIFAKQHIAGKSPDQLRAQYKNWYFFCDEIHNIVSKTGIKKKSSEKRMTKEEIYGYYKMFFKEVDPMRILVSATPMINSVTELNDEIRLLINKDIDVRGMTNQELEPYLRGMISYVKADENVAVTLYQGIRPRYIIDGNVYNLNQVIYPHIMSRLQLESYSKAISRLRGQRGFEKATSQIGIFVFPDGSWGSEGFNRYINLIKHKIERGTKESTINWYSMNEELSRLVSDIDCLRIMSPKFADIIIYCVLANMDRLDKNLPSVAKVINKYGSDKDKIVTEKGLLFAYTEYLTGSGSIVLCLCLEKYGFERFINNSSIFVTGVQSKILCGGGNMEVKLAVSSDNSPPDVPTRRNSILLPKPRFALLTATTNIVTTKMFNTILDTHNSWENRNGDFIFATFVCKVGRESINITNTVRFDLIDPAWNVSTNLQVEKRILRITSHQGLIQDKIKIGIQNPVIGIKIYFHAAVFPWQVNKSDKSILRCNNSEINPNIEASEFPYLMNLEPSDLYIYRLAEEKNEPIEKMMRFLKSISIDGILNLERNDFSYIPYYKFPTEIDESSFKILYSKEIIDDVIYRITNDLSIIIKFPTSISDLEKEFNLPDKKYYIYSALMRIVNENIPLLDKYGRIKYIHIDGNIIFLDDNVDIPDKQPGYLNFYRYGFEMVNRLNSLPRISYDISRIGLSPVDDAKLVEEAILEYHDFITGKIAFESQINKTLRHKYSKYIYVVNEPTELIEKDKQEILKPRGQGRPRKNPIEKYTWEDRPLPPKSPLSEIEKANELMSTFGPIRSAQPLFGSNIVYIHLLLTLEQRNTDAGVVAAFYNVSDGVIRIYKPSEMIRQFRDINKFEDNAYKLLVQQDRQIKKNEMVAKAHNMNQYDMYVLKIPTSSYIRIVNVRELISGEEKDNRKKPSGRSSKTVERYRLIEYLYRLGIYPPQVYNLPELEVYNQLASNKNYSKYIPDMLKYQDRVNFMNFVYSWERSGKGNKDLEKTIIDTLTSLGLVLDYTV